MNRRGFIGSILALGVAPAIVRADSLMRIVPRELGVWTLWAPFSIPGAVVWYIPSGNTLLDIAKSIAYNPP